MSFKTNLMELHPDTLTHCKQLQTVLFQIGIEGVRGILNGLEALSPDGTPSAEQLDEALNYARACAVGEPVSEQQYRVIFIDSAGDEKLESIGYLISRNDRLAIWVATGKVGESIEVYDQLNGTPTSEIDRIYVTEFFHTTHVDAYSDNDMLWCNETQDWV